MDALESILDALENIVDALRNKMGAPESFTEALWGVDALKTIVDAVRNVDAPDTIVIAFELRTRSKACGRSRGRPGRSQAESCPSIDLIVTYF